VRSALGRAAPPRASYLGLLAALASAGALVAQRQLALQPLPRQVPLLLALAPCLASACEGAVLLCTELLPLGGVGRSGSGRAAKGV